MKKIVLLLPAMRMGGAEKVCLNFLEDLQKYFQVTLLLNKLEGELLDKVPKTVNIVEDRLLDFKEIFINDIKSLNIKYVIQDLFYYFNIKHGKNIERNYSYLIKRNPKIYIDCDCAIGYVANVSTQLFSLIDRIDTSLKIAWIHGETTELKDTEFIESYYIQCSQIFVVSEVSKKHFLDRFSKCKDITDVYYNPINKNIVIEGSKDKCLEMSNQSFNIVTVGRMSPEKGFDLIPSIVELLIKNGRDIKWYIVGDGIERKKVENMVSSKRLSNNIILLGTRVNPYPYIKKCDLYVQPSYEEGYSTTICEAGILGKAIIGTTTSGGIKEQLVNNFTGMIVEPNSESITNQILYLMDNDDVKQKLENNIKSIDFSNKNNIYKLMKLL